MDRRVLSLEFEAQFKNVDLARAKLRDFSSDCFGADSDCVDDITIAVNEAMNNAVEHSSSASFTLEMVWNGRELEVSVISDGPSFDPVAASAGLSQEDMLERDEGGYGLYLIRELVDSFEYEYRGSKNIWKLRKKANR